MNCLPYTRINIYRVQIYNKRKEPFSRLSNLKMQIPAHLTTHSAKS